MRYLLITSCLLNFLVLNSIAARAAEEDWKAPLKLGEAYTNVSKKEWKAKPGHDVVLATTKEDNGKVIVAVLKTSEKSPTIIAREKISLDKDCAKSADREIETPGEDATECTEFSLDLAPYRLNETDVAIGIRWNEHEEFPAGESNSKALALLQLKDGKFKKILKTLTHTESEQRGPGDWIETNCTLSVEKTKTKEFFDLKKHCVTTISPLSESDAGENKKVTKKQTDDTMFRWNGKTYAEVADANKK